MNKPSKQLADALAALTAAMTVRGVQIVGIIFPDDVNSKDDADILLRLVDDEDGDSICVRMPTTMFANMSAALGVFLMEAEIVRATERAKQNAQPHDNVERMRELLKELQAQLREQERREQARDN